MPRGREMTLSLPPFSGWVKRLVLLCAGVYLSQVIARALAPQLYPYVEIYLGLVPTLVLHGYLWQVVTYSFLHGSPGHLLVNMLMLWMFGSQEEEDWGPERFLEFYLFCVVGAALVTMVVAYSSLPGLSPRTVTIGASGGVYGILIAFGMLYGDREIFLFPFPISLRAKYLVGILIFLVVIATFQPSQGGVANFAHLGGLFFGFVYIKFMPRRGVNYAVSERYFGLRNSYYRWKRRRAARKFEVYMKQEHDREIKFDELGNYVPPEEKEKKNGGSKSGWVN